MAVSEQKISNLYFVLLRPIIYSVNENQPFAFNIDLFKDDFDFKYKSCLNISACIAWNCRFPVRELMAWSKIIATNDVARQ